MSPVAWRRLLHASHAVATLVLLATGLLMQSPDWRARIVGGYGRQIASVHEYAGIVFLGVPALALALAGRPLVRDARRRLGPPDPPGWKKLHIALSLVGTPVLAATGIVLWFDTAFPLVLADVALEVHAWATWVFLAMLAIHLVAARRKIVARCRERIRGAEPLPEDPLLSADDDPGARTDAATRLDPR